ncbi:MAG: uridine diphosphate-N-acetylglucosamine-binding protein YvcK [Synergistaceae bacterium]|nr:uridine diphosphate-N-acetylglucosamine-binding protein YvcK [Synergistaceae bacterium]MBQ3586009.1 uridine diphosphate-N-acetylglucosamine-binding protein YvcK [Synergistaceae bacterium]MBR0168906.1 uridine diphosphate-N-acetylglucosamine-binding protein YvcK [Synergistaceae bacterium]
MTLFILGVITTLVILFMFGRLKFSSGRPVLERAINRRLSEGPYIVAVGGGTGLSTLLRGIKSFTRNITAVVAVTDEGGSSGRIRNEWGMLPPGDVRNCIAALAENDSELKRILDFRFDRGELAGHSLGNLLLLAVTEMSGDFSKAVEIMNHLLSIRGRVLPVTTEGITLMGKTKGGLTVKGELSISEHGRNLSEIWLEPHDAKPLPDVLSAVDDADVILLGPGSLFTSVIPNLLMKDFADKLRDSNVPSIYICNLMTQPEETQGFNIVQHIEWVSAAVGKTPDYVIANSQAIPEDVTERYAEEGATPLYLDAEQRKIIRNMGCECVEDDIMSVYDSAKEKRVLRHDPQKLASVIFRIIRRIYDD